VKLHFEIIYMHVSFPNILTCKKVLIYFNKKWNGWLKPKIVTYMLVRRGKTLWLKKFPVLVMYILVQSVLFSTVHACCGTSSSALLSLLQKVMVLHFSAKHNLMILSHCTFIHHSQKENTKFFLTNQKPLRIRIYWSASSSTGGVDIP